MAHSQRAAMEAVRNVTSLERQTIELIVDRYFSMLTRHSADGDRPPKDLTRLTLNMDLAAVHGGACPLKLRELLRADDFNFVHDVAGIRRHLNRDTAKLEDGFFPRYAAKAVARR